MGRNRQEKRKLAERRWPLLSNLMACYFHQDLDVLYGSLEGAITADVLYGSLEGAITAAVQAGSIDHRRAILAEWRDWNASEGAVIDIRPFLEFGFSVDLLFKQPIDARYLMNRLYDGLMESVKTETSRQD